MPRRRLARRIRAAVAARIPAKVRSGGERTPPVAPAKRAPRRVALSETEIELASSRIEALTAAPRVTVLVPVHGGDDHVDRCLSSVRRHSPPDVRILVIDDASPDAATRRVLGHHAERDDRVELETQQDNLGFTRTVNRGLQLAGSDDVVLLNSDTVVGPGWVASLRYAAYHRPRIATATAVSDNAGAFSVPEIDGTNELPDGYDVVSYARAVRRVSERRFPWTPTAHGFCTYLRRDALDEVGQFDETRFPRGYGEENDFSVRASRRGYRHVVDDRTWVKHVRSVSFGDEREGLLREGRRVVDRLHPEYTRDVRTFVRSEAMERVRQQVRARLHEPSPAPPSSLRPRILYLVHDGQGGTPATTRDLARAIGDHEPYLLTSDSEVLRLTRIEPDGSERVVETYTLPTPIRFLTPSDAAYRAYLERVLIRFNIELVHVRHVFRHTLDAPAVAAALGIPVVLSVHDHYYVCPTIHLLDQDGRYCAGECTAGPGVCRVGPAWTRPVAPSLKHNYVHEWRSLVDRMLSHVSAIVTTSPSAAQLFERAFPSAPEVTVIEHGRDVRPRRFEQPSDVDAADDALRVLVPGNIEFHKGAETLEELDRRGREDGSVELHILGPIAPEYAHIGVQHGPYRREDFDALVERIRPHLAAILSIWPETYCHTLTESWGCGLPVIGSDLGAVGERIRRHGGGWVVDPRDTDGIWELLQQLRHDPTGIAATARAIGPAHFRSTATMAIEYRRLYRSLQPTASPSLPQVYVLSSREPDRVTAEALRTLAGRSDDDVDLAVARGDGALVALTDVEPGSRVVVELDDEMVAAGLDALLAASTIAEVDVIVSATGAALASREPDVERLRASARSWLLPEAVATTGCSSGSTG